MALHRTCVNACSPSINCGTSVAPFHFISRALWLLKISSTLYYNNNKLFIYPLILSHEMYGIFPSHRPPSLMLASHCPASILMFFFLSYTTLIIARLSVFLNRVFVFLEKCKSFAENFRIIVSTGSLLYVPFLRKKKGQSIWVYII